MGVQVEVKEEVKENEKQEAEEKEHNFHDVT